MVIYPRLEQYCTLVASSFALNALRWLLLLLQVTRDRLMYELDKQYPHYGFGQHKGYGVPAHMAAIHKHGPCEVHRRSFEPVKSMLGWSREKATADTAQDDGIGAQQQGGRIEEGGKPEAAERPPKIRPQNKEGGAAHQGKRRGRGQGGERGRGKKSRSRVEVEVKVMGEGPGGLEAGQDGGLVQEALQGGQTGHTWQQVAGELVAGETLTCPQALVETAIEMGGIAGRKKVKEVAAAGVAPEDGDVKGGGLRAPELVDDAHAEAGKGPAAASLKRRSSKKVKRGKQ